MLEVHQQTCQRAAIAQALTSLSLKFITTEFCVSPPIAPHPTKYVIHNIEFMLPESSHISKGEFIVKTCNTSCEQDYEKVGPAEYAIGKFMAPVWLFD